MQRWTLRSVRAGWSWRASCTTRSATHTARTYVSRLLTKLDVHDRSHLVVMALRAGLIE